MLSRVLAIDGGGIRGVLTAVIIQRLEEAVPGFLSRTQIFAGTSTGGLLALGLAYGLSPNELPDIYTDHGKFIFKRSLGARIGDLFGTLGAKYGNKNLKQVLASYFGGATVEDLIQHACVTTMDLDSRTGLVILPGRRRWKPKIISTVSPQDKDILLVDAGVATAAAPTYFPVYKGLVDGGVYATCPAVVGLIEALKLRGTYGIRGLEYIRLLSLGTGRLFKHIEAEDDDRGVLKWARDIVDLILEGTSDTTEHTAHWLMGPYFARLNPILPRPIGMDDVGRINDLVSLGYKVDLSSLTAWIRKEWMTKETP